MSARRLAAARCSFRLIHLFHDPGQALLAVADDEEVDERGQHLRVLRARAAGDDQRMVERAVLAVQRNAAQVEHGQDVGVADLVLQAEADQVEVATAA